jgi:xylulose-5-phosphate/fructose-6-phosphate phosphoketolase
MQHREYICEHGDDMPDIAEWRWGHSKTASAGATSTEGDNA